MGRFPKSAPAPRSRFFVIGVILAVTIGASHKASYSQSEIKIAGRVIDMVSGDPVPGAMVTLEGLGGYAISDASGGFGFNDLPPGRYLVTARRLGYSESSPVSVNTDRASTAQVVIPMLVKPVAVPGQGVIGMRSPGISISSGGNLLVIEIPRGGLKSIETLIEKVPELELVDSGPRKLLRMRGSQINGVVVMLDGRTANSLLTSQGDVSAIPFSAVTKIEIVKGGSYKTEGLAGSINFITGSALGDAGVSSSVQRGSFGLESYTAQLRTGNARRLYAGVDFRDSYCRGDFTFTDPRDSVQVRDNNFSHDINVFADAGYGFGATRIGMKARYFSRHAGVPGPIFQLTPDANSAAEEKEVYSTLEQDFASSCGITLTGGITRRTARFDSPQTPANFIAYRTRFDEDSRDIKLQFLSKGRIDLDAYFVLKYESLNGFDLIRPQSSFGHHARLVNTLATGLTFHLPQAPVFAASSTMTLGLKKEGGASGDFWGPSGTLRVNLELPMSPGIDASYYRSRRLPDLTDLYWKEDVFATPNPGLLPEKSEGYDLGFDLRVYRFGPYAARVSRFVTQYDDIIIWRKWAGDKFKPVNLSRANISGWEISLDLRPFSGPVSFFWNAGFIKPLNDERELAHYHKYLTFRPIGNQNAGAEFAYRSWRLRLTGRHIGRRYITEENTKSLPPVDLADFDIALNLKLDFLNILSEFSVLNIGNIQYEILDRQPERPREFRLSLELSKKGA